MGPQCAACTHQPPPWARVISAVPYGFPWDQLVTRFKYHQQVDLGRPLAEVMACAVRQAHPQGVDIDRVLPMPLAGERLAHRGFNQAWELARHLGALLRLPAHAALLQRTVAAAPQASLSRAQRLSQLQGMFAVPPRARALLRGQRLALVDDVMTTGATARAAAQVLQDAGGAHVEVWTLARTDVE